MSQICSKSPVERWFLGDVEFFSEALLSAEMFHDVSIIDQDTPQNIILVYINMIRIWFETQWDWCLMQLRKLMELMGFPPYSFQQKNTAPCSHWSEPPGWGPSSPRWAARRHPKARRRPDPPRLPRNLGGNMAGKWKFWGMPRMPRNFLVYAVRYHPVLGGQIFFWRIMIILAITIGRLSSISHAKIMWSWVKAWENPGFYHHLIAGSCGCSSHQHLPCWLQLLVMCKDLSGLEGFKTIQERLWFWWRASVLRTVCEALPFFHFISRVVSRFEIPINP